MTKTKLTSYLKAFFSKKDAAAAEPETTPAPVEEDVDDKEHVENKLKTFFYGKKDAAAAEPETTPAPFEKDVDDKEHVENKLKTFFFGKKDAAAAEPEKRDGETQLATFLPGGECHFTACLV
jgi:Fe-S cluster biosynthesis and repair protein YggX